MAPVQTCVYLSEQRGSSVIGLFSGLHSQDEFSHCCQKRKCPSVLVAELWGSENSHSRCKTSLVLANGAVERNHFLRKCFKVCFLIFLGLFLATMLNSAVTLLLTVAVGVTNKSAKCKSEQLNLNIRQKFISSFLIEKWIHRDSPHLFWSRKIFQSSTENIQWLTFPLIKCNHHLKTTFRICLG